MPRAVRIEPRMQLEAARMRLANRELERIVPGVRRTALLTGQVRRPRLQLRRVQRIRSRTHVQHDGVQDRKSTRLNSSHVKISYAVFCLKKKKKNDTQDIKKVR